MKHAKESFNLQKHLTEEHKIGTFSSYLQEIVYGGNDGIVTTFAVVAGFAGAQSTMTALPVYAVLLFGLANLFADGLSMGLGNFLSSRSEQDLYKNEKAKELYEIRHNKDLEVLESVEIMKMKGFTDKQAKQLIDIYSTNEAYWIDFMMNQELEMPNPENDNPVLNALATFIAFVLFGSIPLLPYIFLGHNALFVHSIIATIIALMLLGTLRWKVTKQSFIRSISEVLFIGGSAALVAYFVGVFLKM